MRYDLEQKRVLVTGGSRGLGRTIVETFAGQGADVAFCARSADAVEATERELSGLGGKVAGSVVDLVDQTSYRKWIETTAEGWGGVDVLVLNATGNAAGESEAALRLAFDVDLLHVTRGLQIARPHLAASSGSVIVIGSASAVMSITPPEERAYAAMKAALTAWASQAAREYAYDGIRVNVVQPGAIDTPGGYWEQTAREQPELVDFVKSMHALGRLAEPREIAEVVAFLASPAASFMVGSVVRADGGLVGAVNF